MSAEVRIRSVAAKFEENAGIVTVGCKMRSSAADFEENQRMVTMEGRKISSGVEDWEEYPGIPRMRV
jgi:hypothetical protein